MAPNGQRYPLESTRSATIQLYAKLTGGGAATSLVNADAANNGGGEIVSATYSSTGVYTVVFRKTWPQLVDAPQFSFVGDVNGFNGVCTAIDVAAGTATFKFANAAVAADVATTTTIYVSWAVRSSGKN